MSKSISVLFIGNSYTYYNEMPNAIFEKIARDNGKDVCVSKIVKGGWTLEKHANPDDEFGKLVYEALDENSKGKYDYVILQEQSVRPAIEEGRELFFDAVRLLVKKIRAIGATPLLYCTWGRKEGNEKLALINLTNESMTQRLAAAYTKIAEELDIAVAHAGLAFKEIYTAHSTDVELYHHDGSHPSSLGSLLAATVIYSKIFGADPRALTLDFDIGIEVCDLIKNAAYNAVFCTPKIPEEYRL